ncbi:hypothetical protein B0H67DRAFT_468942, partial [Lasiosphaeris hirsuta]
PGILFGILVPHIVCTLVTLARTWSRLFLLRKWFLDDTLILLAWAFSTTVCIVYSIAAQSPRLLTPTSDSTTTFSLTTYDQTLLHPYILRTYLGLIFYQLCLCLTKLSILTFYLRIFSSRPLSFRLAWATIITILLYGVPLLFVSVFQCHPSPGLFFGRPVKCFTFAPLLIASASLHTATDAWLIILIVPCIVRLDLPPRQKAALAVVLSLSIFVIAASLTRLQLSLRAGGDGTRVANTLAFYVMTVLELDLALICASAPAMRPVVARLWPKLGMGEPSLPGRRRHHHHHHHHRGSEEDANGSVDLTSVVSYHGYPWTGPPTPAGAGARSKNPSVHNLSSSSGHATEASTLPPVPPLAMLAHRTPTTLSLRSFMSSMAPRSRGQTLAGGGRADDRAVLLRDGEAEDDVAHKRRSSSQESFVLGQNDPNSPSRMSPISDS